jgi:hypothetical protein
MLNYAILSMGIFTQGKNPIGVTPMRAGPVND